MGQFIADIAQIPGLTEGAGLICCWGVYSFTATVCTGGGEGGSFYQNVEFDVHLVSLIAIFESCQPFCAFIAGGCVSCLSGNCSFDLKGRKLKTPLL